MEDEMGVRKATTTDFYASLMRRKSREGDVISMPEFVASDEKNTEIYIA